MLSLLLQQVALFRLVLLVLNRSFCFNSDLDFSGLNLHRKENFASPPVAESRRDFFRRLCDRLHVSDVIVVVEDVFLLLVLEQAEEEVGPGLITWGKGVQFCRQSSSSDDSGGVAGNPSLE